MVKRLVTDEDGKRLKEWLLRYMKDDGNGIQPLRDPWLDGFLIGPTQLCKKAGLDPTMGSTLLGSGSVARPYVPMAEYLRKLVLALREMLEEIEHPRAKEVTVIRAYLESGYLKLEDVADFVESEGLEGWMKEEDYLASLDLDEFDERVQLVIKEMCNFQRLRLRDREAVG